MLVTPWFINLMLLPGAADDWESEPTGASRTFVFPSGCYDFLIGREQGIGVYAACSLFSPVYEFNDHAAAVAVAESVMQVLFEDSISEPREGEPAASEAEQRIQTPMTRRQMLRETFLRDPWE